MQGFTPSSVDQIQKGAPLRAKKLAGINNGSARYSEESGAKCIATVHTELLRIITWIVVMRRERK